MLRDCPETADTAHETATKYEHCFKLSTTFRYRVCRYRKMMYIKALGTILIPKD